MSDIYKIISFDQWKIEVNVTVTRLYYSKFIVENTLSQCYRNYKLYCDNMPENEKVFFDNFEINPICCNVSSIGLCKDGSYPTKVCFLFAGKYINKPDEIIWNVEELIAHNFEDDRPDSRITIGNFQFDFQNPDSEFADMPENIPEGFLCINAWVEEMPWLLNEKSENILIYPLKVWQIFRRIQSIFENKRLVKKNIEEIKNNLIYQFKLLEISYELMQEKEIKRFINKWLLAFSPTNVKMRDIRKICLPTSKNYLWHLFSNNFLIAAETENSAKYYDAIDHDDCIGFLNYEKIGFKIKNSNKLTSDIINKFYDIIITDSNMQWTYVHTHELYFGPYFYNRINK